MDSATNIKQKAQRLIQQGNLQDAMTQYLRLTQGDEVDPAVFILIGDLRLRMAQREEACLEYQKAADGYDRLGLLRNAIAVLKKVLRIQPRHPDAHQRLADLYARKGHLAESVGHYLDHAALRLEVEDEEAAREVLEQVTRLSTPSVRVALRLADLYLALGDRVRAVQELQRLARELEEQGRPDQAQRLREQVLIIEPADGVSSGELLADGETSAVDEALADEAALGVGEVHEDDEALADDEGLADGEAPEDVEALVESLVETDFADVVDEDDAGCETTADGMLGLEHSGDYSAALGAEETAADVDVGAAGLAAASGEAAELEDEETAESDDAPATPSTELEAQDTTSDEECGWKDQLKSLLEAGEQADAEAYLTHLASEAEGAARHHEAAQLYERLWELGRRDPAVAGSLADLYRQIDDVEQQAHWLAELAEMDLSAGRWQEARERFRAVLDIDPHNDLAQRRLTRLDHVTGDADATTAETGEADVDVPTSSDITELLTTVSTDLAAERDGEAAPAPELGDEAMPTPDASSEEDQIDRILTRFRHDISSQLDDRDHAAHYDLALAYVEMGLEREALAELKIAQAGEEHRQRCLELQATCYSRLGEPRTAAEYLRVALEELGPSEQREADLRVRLGTVLMEAGDYEEARQVLRAVVAQHPSHADARQQLEAMEG